MVDKISPLAVTREAMAVSWKRKWSFLGLTLAALVCLLAATGLPALVFGKITAPLLSTALQLLVMFLLTTTSNHLAVTEQRGAGTPFPRPFWPATGRVLGRALVVVLILLGLMILVMVPLGGLAYHLLPSPLADPGDFSSPVLPFLAVLGVAAYFLILGFGLRLGIMIPGAAADRVIKVREALAMTRGHAWRMVWSMLLVLIPLLILMALGNLLLFTEIAGGRIGAGVAAGFALLLAVDLCSWIVMLVMNAVWYERLRLRAGHAGPAFEFSSPGGTVPRAGSGVGPYADLTGHGK